MAIVKLTAAQFAKNKPNTNSNVKLPNNVEIKVLNLVPDTTPAGVEGFKVTPWPDAEHMVNVVLIEFAGEKHEIPLPMIMNMVIQKAGIVHNLDNESMKCVEPVGNRIGDQLKIGADGTADLPQALTIVERIKRGWKALDIAKTDNYGEAFFTKLKGENTGFTEETVPTAYADYLAKSDGFIPQAFKGTQGVIRYAYTHLVLPLK